MKFSLCVIANTGAGGLGLPNRLFEDAGGKPVLARTLDRLKSAAGFDRRAVILSGESRRAREILAAYPEYDVFVSGGDLGARRWLRNSRKWAPHSWRGGLNDTFAADEENNPVDLYCAGMEHGAEFVAVVRGGAAFVDPGLLMAQRRQMITNEQGTNFIFSSGPIGIAGEIFGTTVLAELGKVGSAARAMLKLPLDKPSRCPLFTDSHFVMDPRINRTEGRFLSDTVRGLELLRALGERAGFDAPAQAVVDAYLAFPDLQAGRLPREVDVEITPKTHFQALPAQRAGPGGDVRAAV